MSEYQDQVLSHQNKETKQNIITEMKNKKSLINRELRLNGEQKVILYSAVDRKISIKVFFAQDNFWLTQKTMAELFGVNLPAISKHLKNIYASKELTDKVYVLNNTFLFLQKNLWELYIELPINLHGNHTSKTTYNLYTEGTLLKVIACTTLTIALSIFTVCYAVNIPTIIMDFHPFSMVDVVITYFYIALGCQI